MKKMGYTNIHRTLNGTGTICIYLFTKGLLARNRHFFNNSIFLKYFYVLIKYLYFQP